MLTPPAQILSVSQFIDQLNLLLEDQIVQIRGEVSEVNLFRDSLVFFSLKDAEGVISCWFPRALQYQWGVELQTGIEVIVTARPQVFKRSGRFSLRVLELSYAGEGSLKQALERLRLKLAAEGLFDEARKRRLPFLPARVGLITGDNSAAYSDFVKVVGQRIGGLTIYFAPVRVQGVGSISEICQALNQLGKHKPVLDLIVVTRGGGSLEDLQSFNSEEVCRQVFSCPVPVVAAVGHERDWSLCELVADLRASTPSNAAELIVPARRDLLAKVSAYQQQIEQQLARELTVKQQLVSQRFNTICYRVSEPKRVLTSVKRQLLSSAANYYKLKRHSLQAIRQLIQSYSPQAVLNRGYSVVRAGHKVVKSARQIKAGTRLEIWPAKGLIRAVAETADPDVNII